MSPRWICLFLINIALVFQVSAQITTPPKGKRINEQQKEQIQIDDQLAGRYFREQDYEKAQEIYKKLYHETQQPYHFQQYIESNK